MLEHCLAFVLPSAFALLPEEMQSLEARALLLAIALQETGFRSRRQDAGGPARSFWQFEISGVRQVLTHHATSGDIAAALRTLRYQGATPEELLAALEYHDTLAACFARCLLWTLPAALPSKTDPGAGWRLYLDAWHPGTPRVETWTSNYAVAWTAATKRGGLELNA